MYSHIKLAATTTNIKFKMLVFKNSTSTLGSFVNGSAAKQCTTTGIKTFAGTIFSPMVTQTNRLWFQVTNRASSQTKLRVTLHLQEFYTGTTLPPP